MASTDEKKKVSNATGTCLPPMITHKRAHTHYRIFHVCSWTSAPRFVLFKNTSWTCTPAFDQPASSNHSGGQTEEVEETHTPELLAIAPMGRGKVQLRRIENPANLQVTFSKRKSGLIKKAHEIAVLCDTEVAVIIFSPKGKLYEYSTDSKMRKILDRYEQYSYAEKEVLGSNAQQGDNRGNCTELSRMKHRIECLQKRERQLLGEDLESLNLIELQNIEQKLEDGLRKIRARQNSMLLDSIAELQEKGKLLQERNNALEKKMTQLEEENRALTQAAQKEQQNATGETCSIQDLHINDHVTTLDAGAQVLDSWMLMLGGLNWLELLEESSWAYSLLASDL